jgi:hypothetical protein
MYKIGPIECRTQKEAIKAADTVLNRVNIPAISVYMDTGYWTVIVIHPTIEGWSVERIANDGHNSPESFPPETTLEKISEYMLYDCGTFFNTIEESEAFVRKYAPRFRLRPSYVELVVKRVVDYVKAVKAVKC